MLRNENLKELYPKILEICKISHLESHANAVKNESRHDLVKKGQ